MDFSVWVTSECNMKCKYCYVDEKKGTGFFSEKHIAQLVHFMKEVAGESETNKISFFGGEPLLNISFIKKLIEAIEQENFPAEYYMTINGLLLNRAIAEYLYDKKVFVSLSWDGCETAHDYNRIDGAGKGTYKRVKDAYRLLKEIGMDNVRVRATFNNDTVKYLMESVEDFQREDPEMSVVFSPDYFDKSWSDESIDNLRSQVQATMKKDMGNITILTPFAKEQCFCSGAITNFNIYVDGSVYPCSFVTNIKQFCVGDIWTGLDNEKISSLVRMYDMPIHECEGCDHEKACLSHKCRYLNWALMSDMNKPAPVVCQFENLKWCSNKVDID